MSLARRVPLAVGLAAVLVACGPTGADEPDDDVKALAVMYFENRSPGGEWQWLSTGLADMLITDLGRSERLLVVERERLSYVLQELRLVTGGLIDPANAAKVGQISEVDWVLFGSFLMEADQLTIEAHILEVKTGELLRVEQVEGKAEEVQVLEKRLAEQLLARLDVPLSDEERRLLDYTPTDSLDALSHYYQGIEAYESGDYHRALAEFRLAVRQDPGYVEAHGQVAEMYWRVAEPEHSLVEYRRLTDGDRDNVLPDYIYYGMGRVLESGLGRYEEAVEAYRTIVDRRPEFRFTTEDVKQARQELHEQVRATSGQSRHRLLEQARSTWQELRIPCRTVERIAVCHENLGQPVEAARHYLILTDFIDMRTYMPTGDLRERVREKARTLHAQAVRLNRDRDLPMPTNVTLVPEDGLTFDRTWPQPQDLPLDYAVADQRVFVAAPDREITSLLISTWPARPRPPEGFVEDQFGRRPPRKVRFNVYEYGSDRALSRVGYPPYEGMKRLPQYPPHYENYFQETQDAAEGVSVSEVERHEEGSRTYRVDLPAGIRGIRLWVCLAKWRCQITSALWRGAEVHQGMPSWRPTGVSIRCDPAEFDEVHLDGELRVKLSERRRGWGRGFSFQNLEPGEHVLRVLWPDGRSADVLFEVRLDELTQLLLTPERRVLDRQVVAERGNNPHLFRDRRGRFWLVWDESVKGYFSLQSAPEQTSDLYCSSSPNGRTWGEPRRLPVSSLDVDANPVLQQDSRGTYWLLWVSDRDREVPRAVWVCSSLDGHRWSYPRKLQLEPVEGWEKQWWARGRLTFVVDSRDRFWVGSPWRLTYSDDGVRWRAPIPLDSAGHPGTCFLGCDKRDRLLLLAPRVKKPDDEMILLTSPDGAEWAETAVLGSGGQGSAARAADGTLIVAFGGSGGNPIYVATSEDGDTWSEAAMVDPGGVSRPWHPTVASAGPGHCVVAFSSAEGIVVLRCRIPGAPAAAQELKVPATITGPIEPGPMEGVAQPTILILPFLGEEAGELAPLTAALAEVLTFDVARQEGISVVERSHLEQVLEEQGLTALGDRATQLKVGKLLGAKLLLAGSFGLVEGKLTITASLFDVSTAQLVKSEEVAGEVSDWLEVEKELALALVKDLELKLDEVQMRAIDEKPEVNLHFIRGLGYYYANRYDEAIMEFLNTLYGDEKYVDARYWMARSYLATDEPDHARIELERIVKEYPEHTLAAEAQAHLKSSRDAGRVKE